MCRTDAAPTPRRRSPSLSCPPSRWCSVGAVPGATRLRAAPSPVTDPAAHRHDAGEGNPGGGGELRRTGDGPDHDAVLARRRGGRGADPPGSSRWQLRPLIAELPMIGEVPMLITPEATYLGLPDLRTEASWPASRSWDSPSDSASMLPPAGPPGRSVSCGMRPMRPPRSAPTPSTGSRRPTTGSRRMYGTAGRCRGRWRAAGGCAFTRMELDATTSTDVWIDAGGLVRRLRVELRPAGATDPASHRVSATSSPSPSMASRSM